METPTPLDYDGLAYGASARRETALWPAGVYRENAEIPPHPGRIISHCMSKHFLYLFDSTTSRRKGGVPWLTPPRRVWKPQPHWEFAYWLRLIDPACSDSHPSCQRRGRATKGYDKLTSSNPNPSHISIKLKKRGCKRGTPGWIPPRRVWKREPY